VRRLLVTASVVPTSPILVTLMKEALSPSETSVLKRAIRRNTPEDTILHLITEFEEQIAESWYKRNDPVCMLQTSSSTASFHYPFPVSSMRGIGPYSQLLLHNPTAITTSGRDRIGESHFWQQRSLARRLMYIAFSS
jgi:hypothetical protein